MLLLLSGPAAVGKSSICDVLRDVHGFAAIKSSHFLKEIATERGMPLSRYTLQELGDSLDKDTNFEWIIHKVAVPQMQARSSIVNWFVDSVRKPEQVNCFRKAFSDDVFHCHITASEDTIITRFHARITENPNDQYEVSYADHLRHPNEISSRDMSRFADLELTYDDVEPEQAALQIIRQIESI